MTATGQEQFGAIPVRAGADTRLSAADWRLLTAIAYHDRMSRNGIGCTAAAKTLAAEAGLHPANISRQAARLAEFGYITIERSQRDGRRFVYQVIYDNTAECENVINPDDYLDAEMSEMSANAASLSKEDIKVDDNPDDLVINRDSQGFEKKPKSETKKFCKTVLIDQSKLGAANLVEIGPGGLLIAHQGKPNRSAEPRQRELRVSQDVNQRKRNQRRLAAEQRLGNDLAKAQLIEHLECWAGAERSLYLVETAEYQKAIECEMNLMATA